MWAGSGVGSATRYLRAAATTLSLKKLLQPGPAMNLRGISTLILVIAVLGPTAVSAQPTSAGQIRTQSLEDNPYKVNFRLMLHPGFLYVGLADVVGAYVGVESEFSRTVAVGGSVYIPYFNFDADEAQPSDFFQAEAWVRFNFLDELRRTRVRMTMEQYTSNHYETSQGEHYTSHEIYVDAPTTIRRWRGMRLGAQLLTAPAMLKEDCAGDCAWDATRISAFAGYTWGTQTNRRILFGHYGERSSRLRMAYFGDVLVAPKIDYRQYELNTADTEPPDIGWGLRVGVEMSSGLPSAVGLRMELGGNPGAGGLYAMLSMGLDLNLAVGGGHEPPK